MKKNKLDAIGYVDDQLIEKAEKYTSAKKKNTWTKWVAVAACLSLMIVGTTTIMPKIIHEQGTGNDAGGVQMEGNYSVAVLPADRNLDDVQNASCNEITETEAQNEAGLCDFLPSELPDGYHFDRASIYVTTMKDGTVYKRLLITYRTGEGAKTLPDEEGDKQVSNSNDLGNEFRINIFSFKPDTSAKIYSLEEVRRELTNGNLENDFFYVQYSDHYVGIEPLSLSAEEIIGLIDSIGR